jgi:hypothetical protein
LSRENSGCAEGTKPLSLDPLPTGANAKQATLPTPWDLLNESDVPIGRGFGPLANNPTRLQHQPRRQFLAEDTPHRTLVLLTFQHGGQAGGVGQRL